MEIIVEAFKETILTFSWGEVASTIVITALCFWLSFCNICVVILYIYCFFTI